MGLNIEFVHRIWQNIIQSRTGKAHMFASAWGNFFGTKQTSYSDSGHSKTSENGFNWIFPRVFGSGQILRPKKRLYCFRTPPLSQFLAHCYVKHQIGLLFRSSAESDRSNLQPIILDLKLLWVCMPRIMIHCHRFTLNGSFCALISARTGNIFAILISGSYLGIKKELIAHFSVFLANY